jgi:hypothetical protein
MTAQRLVCFVSLSASLSSEPADTKPLALPLTGGGIQARSACF